MPKKPSFSSKTNVPLLIFATVLVVAGIVASAWFSSHKPSTDTPSVASSTPALVVPADQELTTYDLLLRNESSVTLLRLDGTHDRLTAEDFAKRYPARLPLQGASAANGSPVTFPSATAQPSSGNSDPSGSYIAHLGTAKDDGASTIDISENNTVTQSVVLRDSVGRALKDAMILGWSDPRTVIVSVVATSTRYAYAVSRDGSSAPLAPLPDNLVYQSIQCGRLWFATGVLGQGLESVPTGPSDLISVTGPAATDIKKIAHDDTRLFSSLVCGPQGVAYRMDDGQSYYLSFAGGAPAQELGKRTPLAIVGDGKIIMRDNYDLVLFDLSAKEATKLMALPEGEVEVFAVPKTLDL